MPIDLPACAVQVALLHPDGAPVQGATVSAQLDRTDFFGPALIAAMVSVQTGADGTGALSLFPNDRGVTDSVYEVRVTPPDGGRSRLVQIRVPDVAAAALEDLLVRDGEWISPLLLDDEDGLLLDDDGTLIEG